MRSVPSPTRRALLAIAVVALGLFAVAPPVAQGRLPGESWLNQTVSPSSVRVVTAASANDTTARKRVEASCPTGSVATGGGHSLGDPQIIGDPNTVGDPQILVSRPVGNPPTGWVAVAATTLRFDTPPAWQLSASAVCVATPR